jgi:tryptophanyl-tRNA synthetase
MSKSLGNCIYLSDTPKELAKKVKSMYTDPEHLTVDSPGHLEGNCPFIYLDAFCTDEHFAKYLPEYKNLQELKDHYTRGGLGDGTVKKLLINVLEETLAPIRERRKQWEQDIPGVYEILRKGCEVARAEAAETLNQVRAAMKINYFDDASLIADQAARYRAAK